MGKTALPRRERLADNMLVGFVPEPGESGSADKEPVVAKRWVNPSGSPDRESGSLRVTTASLTTWDSRG